MSKANSNTPTPVLMAYGIFSVVSFVVFHLVAEQEPSSTLTLSAAAQCLGISLLWIQVLSGRGASGISTKTLLLDALAISFRLSSTLFIDGYLPNSPDGDFVYQGFDICALLMLLFLLRYVVVNHLDEPQAADDTLSVGPMLLGCCVLAIFLHGNMDDNPVLDTLWMAGLFTSVIAVLPQFWLISKSGGQVGALTSHYIAAMGFSRFLSGAFAWMAWENLTCDPLIGGFEHARWAIMIAYVLHVILLCDFGFVYIRSMVKHGVNEAMDMSGLAVWV
jgi:hypothetical protein